MLRVMRELRGHRSASVLHCGWATPAGIELARRHGAEPEIWGDGGNPQWVPEPRFAAWLDPRLAARPRPRPHVRRLRPKHAEAWKRAPTAAPPRPPAAAPRPQRRRDQRRRLATAGGRRSPPIGDERDCAGVQTGTCFGRVAVMRGLSNLGRDVALGDASRGYRAAVPVNRKQRPVFSLDEAPGSRCARGLENLRSWWHAGMDRKPDAT
jgi:hypothetical protein